MAKTSPGKKRFCSTAELELITGLTRWQIDDYMAQGILVPTRMGTAPKSPKCWSPDQVRTARAVAALNKLGMSLDEIKDLIGEGSAPFAEVCVKQFIQENRDSRRRVRAAVMSRRQIQDTMHLPKSRFYLRYIPERWLALVPAPSGTLPKTRAHSGKVVGLRLLSEVVGWAPGSTSGTLISSDENMTSSSTYAYLILTSLPMPQPSNDAPTDCGCYAALEAGDEWTLPHMPAICSEACNLCPRYGRAVNDDDRRIWSKAGNDEDAGCALMAKALERPYETGKWSAFTRQVLSLDAGDASDDAPTIRPRFMPLVTQLPMGATACSIPAATFLCMQCDEDEIEVALAQFEEHVASMRHKAISAATERAAHASLLREIREARGMRSPHESHAVDDLCTRDVFEGDPSRFGWTQELDEDEVDGLSLPVKMALDPHSGFIIMCEALPGLRPGAPMRYELQVLIDDEAFRDTL